MCCGGCRKSQKSDRLVISVPMSCPTTSARPAMGSHTGCMGANEADSSLDSTEKCSFRLRPRVYQSSGTEVGSDTSQTGWSEKMGEERVCVF